MKTTKKPDLAPYLAHLENLPFVEGVRVLRIQPQGRGWRETRADAEVLVRTPRKEHRFLVEVKNANLTYEVAQGVIARTRETPQDQWMLFAPYVPPKMARFLVKERIGYVDETGNCYVAIGKDHIALIEGRRPIEKAGRGRGMGAPGHRVLFAILADPHLLNAPVRELARIAGAGKTAVTHTLGRLEADGLIARGATRRHLLNRKQVLDRWLVGYATMVRPRMLVGTYRVLDQDIAMMERRIEEALGDAVKWAWGGGAAAMRLTRYYRGKDTVLHVQNPPEILPAMLHALPATGGPLTILRTPGEIAFNGALPRTAHPLLVYTELLATNDERAREAAEAVWDRFLRTPQ